jgi:hypothetical protein
LCRGIPVLINVAGTKYFMLDSSSHADVAHSHGVNEDDFAHFEFDGKEGILHPDVHDPSWHQIPDSTVQSEQESIREEIRYYMTKREVDVFITRYLKVPLLNYTGEDSRAGEKINTLSIILEQKLGFKPDSGLILQVIGQIYDLPSSPPNEIKKWGEDFLAFLREYCEAWLSEVK